MKKIYALESSNFKMDDGDSNEFWRTHPTEGFHKPYGALEERYALYVECMKSIGEEPITFDEWLNK